MIRCRAAQLRLAIHDKIFEHESGLLFLGHQEAKSNLSLYNIIIAQKLNIIIQQDYINRTIWTINGGNMPIREIFITHRCLNLLRKIGTSNLYPLIYASQLILPSGHTMSWRGILAPEMPRHFLFNFLSNILQPVSEDKRKHPYVIIKDKNNEVSIGFVKKRIHIKKNGKKIECLIIEVCNMEICLDNPQKAIIQKQKCPKIITITQHNALVLPIFIRLSTGATTHVNWYYIVESLNRAKNISANIDIQQLEKTPTINLNGDNLGLWINRWIEQDTLKQELTDIRHHFSSSSFPPFVLLSLPSLFPSLPFFLSFRHLSLSKIQDAHLKGSGGLPKYRNPKDSFGRSGGLPKYGKIKFRLAAQVGFRSIETPKIHKFSLSIGCSERWENSKIHLGGLSCSEEWENSKDLIWWVSEKRKTKKPRFISKIWQASEEWKTKKLRFVRSGGFLKNETQKFVQVGFRRTKTQRFISSGGLLCGKTKIRKIGWSGLLIFRKRRTKIHNSVSVLKPRFSAETELTAKPTDKTKLQNRSQNYCKIE
ncbi:hypothetical protein RIR_jg38702.t1 [Rhizophagus irregularis DAOM 181602=DAOM 197198]|nr:hypothetical protein RIR_jg38702.t1 [Rhizophagus irregularis DAOM 181602=DAOM 197198]